MAHSLLPQQFHPATALSFGSRYFARAVVGRGRADGDERAVAGECGARAGAAKAMLRTVTASLGPAVAMRISVLPLSSKGIVVQWITRSRSASVGARDGGG